MSEFWRNKDILITGANGFKGSWLSIWLNELGANITGLSKNSHCESNILNIGTLNGRINHFYGDINDCDFVNSVIASANPDIIIHMAAQPLVLASYLDPNGTLATNILGTSHLLNELHKLKKVGLKTKVFLNITTDKVYRNKEWLWGYRETDELGGLDPYSCSKSCAEMVTEMYANTFFNTVDMSLATARAGNVIGGGDWSDNRLVPDCIKSFLNNDDIGIRNPNSVRPWQHVVEPLAGYLMLARSLYETPRQFDSWNFGSSHTHQVQEVTKILFNYWQPKVSQIGFSQSEYKESHLLKLDSQKAYQLLNWENIFTIEEVVQHTVEWYLDYFNNEKSSFDITLNQLKHFSSQFYQGTLTIK